MEDSNHTDKFKGQAHGVLAEDSIYNLIVVQAELDQRLCNLGNRMMVDKKSYRNSNSY